MPPFGPKEIAEASIASLSIAKAIIRLVKEAKKNNHQLTADSILLEMLAAIHQTSLSDVNAYETDLSLG